MTRRWKEPAICHHTKGRAPECLWRRFASSEARGRGLRTSTRVRTGRRHVCVCTVLAGCVEFTKLGYSKGVRPAGKKLTKPFKIKKQFPQILNSRGLWGRRELRLRQRDWVLSVHGVSVRSSSGAIVAKWFCDSIQDRCCLCRPFQCSDYFFHITTGRARLWSQGPGCCERWGQAGPCGGGGGRSAPGSPASPRASRGKQRRPNPISQGRSRLQAGAGT